MDPTARRTLTIASLATLATFLDTTILYVAFPDISATFSGTDAAELSWVLNAYTIVFAALLIPAGKVAALIPSSLALVMHAFPRDQIPKAVAIWGAAGAVAGALGPTLGAAIVEGMGWRWAFYLNLPIGVFTVVAGARTVRESSDPDTRVPSAIGVVLVAFAAGVLSYGVVESDRFGWTGARTIAVLGAGVLLTIAFVAHQRRSPAPVLDLDLFSLPNFRWGNLAMLSFGVAFSGCSSARSCSSPRCGVGRSWPQASGSPLARRSSRSWPREPGCWPDASGNDRSSSPAACSTQPAASIGP